jgi:hypothetical protein
MTVALKTPGFYNGWEYFCPTCLSFFSVSAGGSGAAAYCPFCGIDGLITGPRQLAEFCRENDVDPAGYRGAFPPDGPAHAKGGTV